MDKTKNSTEERSTSAVAPDIKKGQFKTRAIDFPETDSDYLLSALKGGISKGEAKTLSTQVAGINEVRSKDAFAHGKIKEQFKAYQMELTEPDTAQILDSAGRGIIKKKVKTQSKRHVESTIEPMTDIVKKEKIIAEIKEQLKSYAGMNFFKNKEMSTFQDDFFLTSPIAPTKLSTNVINFSSYDNQGMNLFKNKKEFSHHQKRLSSKDISAIKFPTKVVNVSPFDNQGRTYEEISPHMNEPSYLHQRTSSTRSSIYKTIRFPSLTKESPGHPKKLISNKKNFEETNTLPVVIPKQRKSIYKEPPTTAGKHSTYLYS
ncbi:coiled-coil domain-containing protein 7-like [Pipistrellus kuhlii]|uniref:coiled-coil domain-containing protein 7-like n=1 Tax=Pipistrellus kuhlii TaxID=59472 RepID=UPI00174F7BA3|nr:coiled-coil domain-containing protein 7-like [Pipistrellus kuhlii]